MTHPSHPVDASGMVPSAPSRSRSQNTSALLSGALFGFGLALSMMIRPGVVLSFLRFRDFGLALVLGGAVVVAFCAYRFVPRLLSRPLLGGTFRAHEATMSRATVGGAAIFGIGWGLTGVCPGPAIAGLGAGSFELLFAVAGMAIGALLQGLVHSPPASTR